MVPTRIKDIQFLGILFHTDNLEDNIYFYLQLLKGQEL